MKIGMHRNFGRLLGVTLGAFAAMAGLTLQRGADPDAFIPSDRRGKGHGWTRRRKLKKSHQNHQRNVSPSRRHG